MSEGARAGETVSAVIPLYNKEREIERAVRSVLGQTCPPGELIVVDDGSTDRGASVVQGIGDSRVRLVSQPNGGVSSARNRGVAEARGGVVAFLDADDEWLPGFVETILSLRARHPDAGFWATAFDLVSGPRGERVRLRWSGVPRDPAGGLVADFFRSSMKVPLASASSFAMSKAVFGALGGFPAGVALGEDMALWVRAALAHPVAFSPSVQALYHKDASNRAMNRHRYEGRDTPLTRILEDALASGTMPHARRRSVEKYLAQHLLEIARHAAAGGNGPLARNLLREVLLRHRAFPLRCLRRWVRSYKEPGSRSAAGT